MPLSQKRQVVSAVCRLPDRVFRASVVVALLSVMLGCGYGDGAWKAIEGRRFPFAKMSKVHKGQSATAVLSELGPPLTVDKKGTERWRYYVLLTKVDSYLFLDRFPIRHRRHTGRAEAFISFRNGLVEDVTFSHTKN